jgi:hypothetical protein
MPTTWSTPLNAQPHPQGRVLTHVYCQPATKSASRNNSKEMVCYEPMQHAVLE